MTVGNIHTKQDVITQLREHKERIIQLGVEKLGVFGSFRRDDQTAGSDIDLLIQFAEGEKTFDNYMNLHDFLEAILNQDVEIVTPESLGAHIGPHILQTTEYVSLSSWDS